MAANATNATAEITSLPTEWLLPSSIELFMGGIAVGSSLVFFGFAIYRGYESELCPRVANRPPNVVKNAMFYHLPQWMKNQPLWYPVGWLGWAFHLTYRECHKGIPGTGTRKDGTEGPLLKCNLDGVILMRYQTLFFKVGVLVFVLCAFVILPINITATCNVEIFGVGTCAQRLVDDSFFRGTTINNIPDKIFNPTNQTVNVTFETGDIFLGFNENSTSAPMPTPNSTANATSALDSTMDFLSQTENNIIEFIDKFWLEDQTKRVFVTVISCVLIYVYTLYLLTWEWIENVALRRKYFLEATHYSQRTAELNKMTLEKELNDSLLTEGRYDSENCLENDKVLASRLRRERNNKNNNRPEHLTHPEITETPPSIGVFSVLYKLPPSMVTYNTDGATSLERQLVATTNFFDEIIPPENGFSSSVAAVTVLPNAKLLSRARAKWEICERKLQKLRYTRKKLRLAEEKQEEYEGKERERQRQLLLSGVETTIDQCEEKIINKQIQMKYNINGRESTTQAKYDTKSHPNSNINSKINNNSNKNAKIIGTCINLDGSIESISSSEKSKSSIMRRSTLQKYEMETPEVIEIASMEAPSSPLRLSSANGSSKFHSQDTTFIDTNVNTADRSQNVSVFMYEDFNVSEYASSIGFYEEVHNTAGFVQGMGIEEFNVFAFKCAVIAGLNPGFDKGIFSQCGIETLRELEKDLIKEVREANQELMQARQDVVMVTDDQELEDTKLPLQPAITCDDNDSTVGRYGECEVAGHLSIGIRRRKSSGISTENRNATVTSLQSRGIEQRSDVGDYIPTKPKLPTILRSLLGIFKFILVFPKRVYCGKEGSDDFRDLQKYYGTKDPSDTENGRSKGFITNLYHPSYAVVTFTTRHAAIIARQCLADGSAQNRWKQVDDIPLYPLADAPPWEIMRPVTPTISYTSKKFREWIVFILFLAMTITYVYILDQINSVILNPTLFSKAFAISLERADQWSSTASGVTQTLLFSVSPTIFKVLANIEGSATSEGKSEQKAMVYFWYFFIVARFMGNIVWNAWLDFWQGTSAENSINEAITQLSRTATTTLGPLAWSYIISSCTLTWPIFYFLQFPHLATSFLRLNWFNRILKNGGPGAEVSYRVYVDSGYVFAVMTALAPLCPLLGFCCLLYFIIIVPMMRWLIVFAYRPVFDGGGAKWPSLHHIIVSSLILGQLITSITLFLKQNKYMGLFIGLCIVPTLIYNSIILEKYLRPYQEAALLQSRRMYSHVGDSSAHTNTSLEQEEYRRWLVDCHKASYLPTALSGGTENLLTAEPAVVTSDGMASIVETEDIRDDGLNGMEEESWDGKKKKDRNIIPRTLLKRQKAQKGGILHRQRFNI